MANKVVINLRNGTNLRDLNNNDILMYDATRKDFYVVTPETFFDKYESKLNALLERYDKNNNSMKNEIDSLKKEFYDFTVKIKDSNSKLIEMVEKFIKGE